jgi:thiol-disulfide isomerase/thioredoxin
MHHFALSILLLLNIIYTGQAKAPAPSLEVRDIRGAKQRPLDPAALKRSRATVLLFTAHDCPISNALAPEVQRIHAAYAAKGARFFLVYPDPSLPTGAAARHVKEFGYTMPALLDPDQKLVRRAGATVTPEAAVIAPDGAVRYRGRVNDLYLDFGTKRYAVQSHDLRRALDAVLAGKPVRTPRTRAVGCFIPPRIPAG